nr:unnamed protein product [Spirometra erinaceieuropaei]
MSHVGALTRVCTEPKAPTCLNGQSSPVIIASIAPLWKPERGTRITPVDIMAFKCLNSELGSIPQGIHPDTRNLDLSNNKIEILHEDSFLGFRHLQILHLDDNRIFKITDRAFDALALTLEYLSLRRNRLSLRVPSNFPASALSKLKNLRSLDLSGNPLGTVVTEWFSPLGETLQMLHISNLIGPVEIQNNAFAGLGLLEDFDLSNNEFSSFPENAFEGIRPEKLTALNLTHIPWVCDCRLLWLRHWLVQVHLPPNLEEKGITSTCMYPKEFSKMTLLDLPVTNFQCVPKLQAINTTAANIFAQSSTFLHVSSVAGETVQLQCMFLSQPKMLVSWYKNGVLLRPELKRITQETSKGSRFSTTLTIYDLQHGHDCADAFMGKLYKCQPNDQNDKLQHYGHYVDDVFGSFVPFASSRG